MLLSWLLQPLEQAG
ncbi:unnamed protein product [Victoria cruziana]